MTLAESPGGNTPLDEKFSQSQVVVDGIRSMIASGELAASSRLPVEKDLGARLNVSRGPLREGVRALCMMGVLETRQGSGTFVTSLQPSLLLASISSLVDLHAPQDSAHIQAVRRVLETEAAGVAAIVGANSELAAAATILSTVDALVAGDGPLDHERIMETDVEFHRAIARASANPVLEALIEALAGRTIRARLWRALSEENAVLATHTEHRAILEAIQRRDPDAARLRMGVHLLGVEDFMQRHPATMETNGTHAVARRGGPRRR